MAPLRAVRTTYLKSVDESKSPKHINIQLGDEDLIAVGVVNSTITVNNTILLPQPRQKADESQSPEFKIVGGDEEPVKSAKWLQKAGKLGLKGIYKIDGDRLEYCFAQPGDERPSSFKVEKGSGYTLIRLKRFSTGEEKIEQQLGTANARVQKDEIGWITVVTIKNADNADELLSAAASLKKLRRVSIVDSAVSPKGFQNLARIPELNSLTLKANAHPISGLEALASRPKLRDVALSGSYVNDEVLASASQLKQLQELDLSQISASSNAVKELVSSLRLLTRLDVDGVTLESDAWDAIADIPNLRTLSAARSNITDEDMAGLRRLEQLTGLLIYKTAVSDNGLRELVNLNKLDFLRIDGTLVTDESLKLIARSFPNLRTLYIHNVGPKVTDAGLLVLGQHPALNYIHVSKGKFSKDALETVRKVRKDLRVID